MQLHVMCLAIVPGNEAVADWGPGIGQQLLMFAIATKQLRRAVFFIRLE